MSQSNNLSAEPGAINLDPAIHDALNQGATLAISISGGKDSHALLIALTHWFRQESYTGQLIAVHADLGRAEWPETSGFVQKMCEEARIPLLVVRRPKGDLVARFEERLETLRGTDKPFWSSAQNRYCTSHMKGGPIDTELRKPFWSSSANRYCTSDMKRGPIDTTLRNHQIIISAEGVRADESIARAKKPVVEVRSGITATSLDFALNLASMPPALALRLRQPHQRVALNWRPLLNWTTEQVWQAIGTSGTELGRRQQLYKQGFQREALGGWPGHPAYVYGNKRLSCALCVLGSKDDLLNGANHNPDLYGHYLKLEKEGKATFKNGWSLSELPVIGRAAEVRKEVLGL